MAPPLLTLKDISLTFGSTPLLERADFSVYARDRICLVGRNGSGKSTLLKIAAGLIEPDGGERFVKPGTSWRYLPQDPDLSAFADVNAYVQDGLVGADDGFRIPYLLDALGLSGSEDPSHMSGGERRRAALVRTLAPQPDILMLDEPTNHLDLPAIEWLESELGGMNAALVLISHDRRFLESLSRKTLWMDRGETRELDKGFAHFEDWRDEYLEQEELDRHKLARQIHREQHWVVHGVSGRRKRNVRRMKELGNLRQELKSAKKSVGQADITVTQGKTSGKRVARLEHVTKGFDGRIVVDDVSMRIHRGERIGVVGPNGSGKTTLLKLIMGELEPDDGRVELGLNLEPLVIDQNRETLDPDWTLADALTDGGGDTVIVADQSRNVIGYMKDFLFLPEQKRTPVHALSGGERGRLQLARGLRLPSNLLVLDEPTNDLDLETLDLLQEIVADYSGTVIVVSHDRDFLDRTVTRTLAYEGHGQWQVYAGGYSDLINQRGAGVRSRKAEVTAKKKASKSEDKPSSGGTKLSYKHKFRLENLPKDIDKIKKQIADYNSVLADPELYATDADKFMAASLSLGEAQKKLEGLEEEWIELELLREEAEG